MSGILTHSPHLTAREAAHQPAAAEPSSDELDAYLHLGAADVARLVLCLLVEEALRDRLAIFRGGRQDLRPEPV